MMKRFIALFLMIMMTLPVFAWAEHPTDDFSWLDDMSINQLKALDAEIHKRLPAETADSTADQNGETTGLLGLLLGNSADKETSTEAEALSVGQKIIHDSSEFEILEISFLRLKDKNPSGWVKVSGHNIKEDFNVDSDCSLLQIFYRVKNTSTKSKWFWPSNLKATIQWGDYEFELLSAKPFGDLQSTQTKTYVAVAEIPNSILKTGCDDIVIKIGFKEDFSSLNGLKYADHRYILHTSYPSGR